MAFGRDGSELELSVLDMQVRLMETALKRIIRKSHDQAVMDIARKALKQSAEMGKRLEN